MRVHVAPRTDISDGRQTAIVAAVRAAGYAIRAASVVEVYIVENVPALSEEAAEGFFRAPNGTAASGPPRSIPSSRDIPFRRSSALM